MIAAVIAATICSCANIGSPEGGPRDYDAPVLMRTSPQMGATNFTGNKVEIVFDEIVQLKDQQKNLIISPVQKEQPIVKCLGKRIVVEFRDEMQPNTTYCIDFGNAIEDNNEGNPLRNFAFSFSTGSEIDTLEMSGIALRANDLEPVQYALVGLHSNLDDTAFTSLPFERVCRTNDRGQFTLRNLKPGNYHVFALNDMDGDFKMARTEDVAFLDYTVSPSANIVTSQDTTFTFDHKIDTIVTAQHTQFLPNDLLLDMFNSNYRSLYLKKSERIDSTRMHILFSNATQMPDIKLIKPVYYSDKPWYVLQNNERNDSLFLWITDPALVATDSLSIEMTYLQTDKNDSITLKTDTLNFVTRRYNADIK
ncbi:MAG: Ig-like domain-containing protein, partial [Muribaculaceae bacterium]|nr:Ig-like domain-containing protein [Muribaculaceae bacterium]